MTARILPGDVGYEEDVKRMIRVDHAGEYGATRIYRGQLAVLGKRPHERALLTHMEEQEQQHLAAFERIMKERGVRPTALLPVWHVAGFALGAATALLGPKAAMACTVAVETVIDEHYAEQHARLREEDRPLADTIETFRQEELEHRETGLAEGAQDTALYPVLTAAVQGASRLAIWLSTRI